MSTCCCVDPVVVSLQGQVSTFVSIEYLTIVPSYLGWLLSKVLIVFTFLLQTALL